MIGNAALGTVLFGRVWLCTNYFRTRLPVFQRSTVKLIETFGSTSCGLNYLFNLIRVLVSKVIKQMCVDIYHCVLLCLDDLVYAIGSPRLGGSTHAAVAI